MKPVVQLIATSAKKTKKHLKNTITANSFKLNINIYQNK